MKFNITVLRVDGEILFEDGYVWTWKFWNPERKICGLKKYPDACGRGPNLAMGMRLFAMNSTPYVVQ